MAVVKPFLCVRPEPEAASRVAALPYDVYSREEARREVEREPLSFLRIDRAETQFPDEVDTYADCVYQKAGELLREMMDQGIFVQEKEPCYYIYELTMGGRAQTGIVACTAVDDYVSGVIRKHENTRADKEADRIRHVEACGAQTGPIFLAYRAREEISRLMEAEKGQAPLYDFLASDGVRHRVWRTRRLREIGEAFGQVPALYIADGHHRAASAVKAGLKRRRESLSRNGEEPFDSVLSVLFPDDQLLIMDYNRVVKDLNGLEPREFLKQVSEAFAIAPAGKEAVHPRKKGELGMYLDGCWYRLESRWIPTGDPVEDLDVSILQNTLLEPVLGIGDPRTDERIGFVGGIRGLEELERRCHEDMRVAFSMYPTSIGELFRVADAGRLMPPKSTWFEPKLRSGLFIHMLG